MEKLSRRGLLAALAGTGLIISTARSAQAFTEHSGEARLEALRDTACGASSSHRQLVDEVERVLGDKYSADEKRAVIATMTCPVCGCPLAGLF
jgi:predicted deacylase